MVGEYLAAGSGRNAEIPVPVGIRIGFLGEGPIYARADCCILQ